MRNLRLGPLQQLINHGFTGETYPQHKWKQYSNSRHMRAPNLLQNSAATTLYLPNISAGSKHNKAALIPLETPPESLTL